MRAADRQFDEAMVAQEVKGSRGEKVVPNSNYYIFLPGAGHRSRLWWRRVCIASIASIEGSRLGALTSV